MGEKIKMNLFFVELLRYVFLFFIYIFLYRVIVIIRKDIFLADSDRPAGYIHIIRSDCQELPSGDKVPIIVPFTIGKSEDNDIVINNGYMSHKHVRIFLKDNKLFIEDLNSTNGTMLNGEQLKEPKILNKGDKIDIAGVVMFEFRLK